MAKTAPANRVAFRADTRAPAVIFANGFSPRYGGGIKVTKGGQMTGGVSTSKDLGVALRYAALYDGYVYAVFLDSGVDVVNYLHSKHKGESLDNAMTQMEIAVGNVAANRVIGARKATEKEGKCSLTGPTTKNAQCNVNDKDKKMGEAFLALDVTVPSK